MANWYESNPKWESVRKRALRRDNYQDKELSRYGKIKEAEVVHHIFPREDYPEYQYELWNLISLTRKSHNQMHDRLTNELTQKGIDLLKRTCRKYNIPVPTEYELTKPKFKKEKIGFYPPQG